MQVFQMSCNKKTCSRPFSDIFQVIELNKTSQGIWYCVELVSLIGVKNISSPRYWILVSLRYSFQHSDKHPHLCSMESPSPRIYKMNTKNSCQSKRMILYFLHILNRCANCFDCPSCSNTLSTRATAVAIQSDKGGDDSKATQAKKVYYLACGFCRWSSRDIGIEDKSVGEFVFFLSCIR